jgi:hypothetical protein
MATKGTACPAAMSFRRSESGELVFRSPADAVHDLPLPYTLEGVILVPHFPESREFRLRHQCPTGRIIVIPPD